MALVSNIVQFIDLGTKVAKRLDEMRVTIEDSPRVFQAIRIQLPLLVDTLQQVKAQAEQGNISASTEKALIPVIDGCMEQVNSVDEIIQKIVVVAGDSSWQRSRKALARSV